MICELYFPIWTAIWYYLCNFVYLTHCNSFVYSWFYQIGVNVLHITFPHFESLSTRHWSLRLCASSLRFRTDFLGGLNFLINLLRQFLFGSLIYFLPLGVREWEKVWNLCSGLWLVRTDHVTLSMASDWSRQRVSDCRTPAECYTSNWGKQQNTGLESILTTYFQIAASMSWLRVTLI